MESLEKCPENQKPPLASSTKRRPVIRTQRSSSRRSFFAFGALFGTIGWLLRSASRKSALRQIDALTRGHVAEGQLIGVRPDLSETINGRNPYRIDYVFYVNGQPLGGSTKGWDIVNMRRQPGEPLWVVFLPEDPTTNSIWPPIA